MDQKKHRSLWYVLLLVLSLVLLGGRALAATTISLHHCFNGDLDQADIQEIVSRFEKANPHITVDIEMFEPPLVWWTLKDRTSKLEKGCPHHGRNARQVPTTV